MFNPEDELLENDEPVIQESNLGTQSLFGDDEKTLNEDRKSVV